MRRIPFIAFACLAIADPSWAQDSLTGLNLLNACEAADGSYGSAVCYALILGYTSGAEFGSYVAVAKVSGMEYKDNMLVARSLLGYCLPDAATNEQNTKVILKFLKDHPERLHESPQFLIPAALSEAFPCPSVPAALEQKPER